MPFSGSTWPVRYIPGGDLHIFEISSYIRGYHVYQYSWTPVLEEMLILRSEPTNEADHNAVAVLNDDGVVGHAPFNLAPIYNYIFSQFLSREVNKGFSKVTGQRINRGAGYGLEIPCQYNNIIWTLVIIMLIN